jgi:dipeptidyl-peptidase-4
MTYPGEKHGFRSTANKIHRDRLILDFFDRTLKGSAEKKTKTAS